MATIDSKEMIDQLLRNNGHYLDDPPVVAIVEYTTEFGRQTWAVMYPLDPVDRYRETYYVRSPRVIFRHAPHPGCPVGRLPGVDLGRGRWETEDGPSQPAR